VNFALVAVLMLVSTWRAALAADVLVVGVSHLETLRPKASDAQSNAVVEQLSRWKPTLVCVEAMPPEKVEHLLTQPAANGLVLETFAGEAVRLAPVQQLRLRMGAHAARTEALSIAQEGASLSPDRRLRLIALQMASHDPHSALLNWMQLDPEDAKAAEQVLGKRAVADLKIAAASSNEIVSIAIPLAIRGGHRRLCSVDSFVDEVRVQALVEPLKNILNDPQVARQLKSFQEQEASRWHHDQPGGLLGLLTWLNGPDFEALDRAAQWDIFARPHIPHRAGLRRLAYWHARNGEIVTNTLRAVAEKDGDRVLLLIGAAHRPFLHRTLLAQPWLVVHTPTSALLP